MFWVGDSCNDDNDGKTKNKKLEMKDNLLGAFGRIAMVFP